LTLAEGIRVSTGTFTATQGLRVDLATAPLAADIVFAEQ
jgi:hypothetical protein